MVNRVSTTFGFAFMSDGSSTTVTVNLTTQPCFIIQEGLAQPLTNYSLASLAGVTGLVCDTGITVTSAVILLGVLTITLSAPGVNGALNNVSGYLLF